MSPTEELKNPPLEGLAVDGPSAKCRCILWLCLQGDASGWKVCAELNGKGLIVL